tara:strand:- start:74 stop:676 length:603 start_codon:yes stop_codon:yes gene_type:complete
MKDLLFPTTIHWYDNVLEPEYIDSMIEYLETEGADKIKFGHQLQTKPDIHKHNKFKVLTEKVMSLSKIYFNEMNWLYDDYVITDMWGTISPANHYHRPHTHSNNILSGVFYLKSDEAASIVFDDPRQQAHVLAPKTKQWQLNNAAKWQYPSKVNRLILFPSYLLHHVPVNTSTENRISVAFNLMFKGTVGESTEYQSAEF